MWLQSRVAGSQVDIRFGSQFLVLTHDLAQKFGTEAVHQRLAVLSVHQAGELFKLLQDVGLEVPFLTELQEDVMKLGVLIQLVQGSPLSFPFPFPLKALVQSSPLYTYMPSLVANCILSMVNLDIAITVRLFDCHMSVWKI